MNGVAPGPTDTGMLTRFTGTPQNKAALATSVENSFSRRTGSPPLKGVSGYARFHSANRAALP